MNKPKTETTKGALVLRFQVLLNLFISKVLTINPITIPVPRYWKLSGSSKKKSEMFFDGILLIVVENVKLETSPEFTKAIGLKRKKLDPLAFPP